MAGIAQACLAAAALLSADAWAADLRVGRAAVKITPPEGAPMAGYYYDRGADGVHDDLHAKAIVMETGATRAALVACDLGSLPREFVDRARALIRKDTGIEHVMISATHSHTGPVLLGSQSRYRPQGKMLEIVQRYAEELPGKIAQAVSLAAAALEPATATAGIGREESLVFNRRFFMSDGTVGWNPGKLNPKIVKPAGPVDPDVGVVYFETAAGKPAATYVNYALHLDTVGGTRYSADYPFTVETLLRAVKGGDMMTLFTIGCAGNVNHIDTGTRTPQKGPGEAARIGTILAAEVLKTYRRLEPVKAPSLRAASEIVHLPLPAIQPGEVEKVRPIAATFGQRNAAPFLQLVHAFKVLDVAAREGKPLEAEVHAIALGNDLAFVSLPGEIFVELGMAIKKASPFRHTIIAELANGTVGYVPNRKAYPEGNYEVVSARCGPGSGELLVDAAVRLLKSLKLD
jgi:hypothetical protein